MKRSKIKTIWRKRKHRLDIWNNETKTFTVILENRWPYSQLSWKKIEVKAWCFAHMLGKWMYPKYRLHPDFSTYIVHKSTLKYKWFIEYLYKDYDKINEKVSRHLKSKSIDYNLSLLFLLIFIIINIFYIINI